MPLDSETARYQEALARICRSGEPEEIPGVSQAKARVYRDLIRGGVEEALRKAFPLTQQLLSARGAWNPLVDEFLKAEKLVSPQLWQMPRQLLDFVLREKYAARVGIAYLNELLDFEWLEIELFMMPDLKRPAAVLPGDTLLSPAVINPEHRIRSYVYPVFKTPVLELDAAPRGEYKMVCFRHAESGQVRFMEISFVFSVFLERLAAAPVSAADFLESIAGLAGSVPAETARAQMKSFVTSCLSEGLLLGFLKSER